MNSLSFSKDSNSLLHWSRNSFANNGSAVFNANGNINGNNAKPTVNNNVNPTSGLKNPPPNPPPPQTVEQQRSLTSSGTRDSLDSAADRVIEEVRGLRQTLTQTKKPVTSAVADSLSILNLTEADMAGFGLQ